jgi:hypothetical protein
MSRLSLLRTDDFTGGLNLRADPFQLGRTESPDLLNVDIDPRGGLTVRGGMTKLNVSAIGSIANGSFTPKALYAWDNAIPQVLLSANSAVYSATTTAFTSLGITTTAPFGASFTAWSASNESFVYIGTGASSYKWNGTTATALTDASTAYADDYSAPVTGYAPKCRLISSHVDRLWCAYTTEGGVDYPNRVRFSHPINRESWATNDYIDIVDGGSGITAIIPFNGNLLIFKKRAVFAIMGYSTDTFQVINLTSEVGAVNPLSVVATEAAVYFFSWPDGLFKYDGQQFSDLFTAIRPLIQTGNVNNIAQDEIRVASVNHKIWVSLPLSTDTKVTASYIYDPSLKQAGAWSKYQTCDLKGVGSGCDFVTSTGATYNLVCHPSNPYVLRVDQLSVYQDDVGTGPTDFESYYTTGWQDANNVSNRKMWRRPDFVVKQTTVATNLTMRVYHDWEESVIAKTYIVATDASGTSLVWTNLISLVYNNTVNLYNANAQYNAVEPDGNAGWSEADWGASASGSAFIIGKSLGLARSVQLKIQGEGGKPWGINSITYKYNPRKVRA